MKQFIMVTKDDGNKDWHNFPDDKVYVHELMIYNT